MIRSFLTLVLLLVFLVPLTPTAFAQTQANILASSVDVPAGETVIVATGIPRPNQLKTLDIKVHQDSAAVTSTWTWEHANNKDTPVYSTLTPGPLNTAATPISESFAFEAAGATPTYSGTVGVRTGDSMLGRLKCTNSAGITLTVNSIYGAR